MVLKQQVDAQLNIAGEVNVVKLFKKEEEVPNDFVGETIILEHSTYTIYKFCWGKSTHQTRAFYSQRQNGEISG